MGEFVLCTLEGVAIPSIPPWLIFFSMPGLAFILSILITKLAC